MPRLATMASGAPYLVLQACAAHEVPALAAEWAQRLGAILGRRIEAPDQIQLETSIDGHTCWLAWDRWEEALTLEPRGPAAAAAMTGWLVRCGGA